MEFRFKILNEGRELFTEWATGDASVDGKAVPEMQQLRAEFPNAAISYEERGGEGVAPLAWMKLAGGTKDLGTALESKGYKVRWDGEVPLAAGCSNKAGLPRLKAVVKELRAK